MAYGRMVQTDDGLGVIGETWVPEGGERTTQAGLDLWRPNAESAWYDMGALGNRSIDEMEAIRPSTQWNHAGNVITPAENFAELGWFENALPSTSAHGGYNVAWNANEGRFEETGDKMSGDTFSNALDPAKVMERQFDTTKAAFSGEDPSDVLAMYEDDARATTQPTRNEFFDLNSSIADASRGTIGSEMTDILNPGAVSVESMEASHERGNDWNTAYGDSIQNWSQRGGTLWSDAFRNVGDWFGEDPDRKGQGGGLGDSLARVGDEWSDAETQRVGTQVAGAGEAQKGKREEGLKTGAKGYEEWIKDPVVGTVVATAVSMGLAGPALAAYLSTALPEAIVAALGTQGMSALASAVSSGAITAVRGGDEEQILQNMAASGLGSYASGFSPDTGSAALDAALKSGSGSAVRQLVQTGEIDPENLAASALGSGVNVAAGGGGLGGLASGAVRGAITGGSEGATTGAVRGALSGYGREHGGSTGQAIGNAAGRYYASNA